MALTVSKIAGREAPEPDGIGFRTVRKVVPDTSWLAAGEALTHEQLGFSKAPDFVEVYAEVGGYVAAYDITNGCCSSTGSTRPSTVPRWPRSSTRPTFPRSRSSWSPTVASSPNPPAPRRAER